MAKLREGDIGSSFSCGGGGGGIRDWAGWICGGRGVEGSGGGGDSTGDISVSLISPSSRERALSRSIGSGLRSAETTGGAAGDEAIEETSAGCSFP